MTDGDLSEKAPQSRSSPGAKVIASERRLVIHVRDLFVVLGLFVSSWALVAWLIYSLQFVLPSYTASSERPGSGVLLAIHDFFPVPLIALGSGMTLRWLLQSRRAVLWAVLLGCLLGSWWGFLPAWRGGDEFSREMRSASHIIGALTVLACVLGAFLVRPKSRRHEIGV